MEFRFRVLQKTFGLMKHKARGQFRISHKYFMIYICHETWETMVHWADWECTEILDGNHFFLFPLWLFHFLIFISSITFLPPALLKLFFP
jgi:hypothetical protein